MCEDLPRSDDPHFDSNHAFVTLPALLAGEDGNDSDDVQRTHE